MRGGWRTHLISIIFSPSRDTLVMQPSILVREHWIPLFDAQTNIQVAFENHEHTYKRTPPIRGLEVSRDDGIVCVAR